MVAEYTDAQIETYYANIYKAAYGYDPLDPDWAKWDNKEETEEQED